jgi:glycosyltransferase involved in cell wall biosynthesis
MSKVKNLVILTDYFEPAVNGGGPIQSIKGILSMFHEEMDIHIITRNRDIDSNDRFSQLKSNEWLQINNHKGQVFYASNLIHIIKALKNFKGKHYTLYINSFFSPLFSICILFIRFLKIISPQKLLLAPRGELKKASLIIKSSKKSFYLLINWLTFSVLYRGVCFHVTSREELKDIEKQFPLNQIKILPNLKYIPEQKYSHVSKRKNKLSIVFISRIIHYKNLLESIKIIRYSKNRQQISLDIYGPIEDFKYFDSCMELIQQYGLTENIKYKGIINSNQVYSVLSKYDLFIFPTAGENYGHVIAESFLAGTPVLISDQTPWKHLEKNSAGWSFPLDSLEVFTKVIDSLFCLDEESYKRYRIGALAYAKSQINLPETINGYAKAFQNNSSQKKIYHVAPFVKKRYKGGITNLVTYIKNNCYYNDFELNFISSYTIEPPLHFIGKIGIIQSIDAILLVVKLLLKAKDASLFHFHTSRKTGLIKDLILLRLVSFFVPKAKILLHIHYSGLDWTLPYNAVWKMFCLNQLKRYHIISLTQIFKDQLLKFTDERKVSVLNNFSTLYNRKESNLNKNDKKEINLFFIGSIEQRKGIFELIHMLKSFPDPKSFRLTVYGKPISKENKKMFDELLSDNNFINYVGYLDEDEIASSISDSDIFIQSSYSEGLSIALLNAINMGCISIASEVDSVVEINENYKNMILSYPIGDFNYLEDLLKKIFDDSNLRDSLKNNRSNLPKDFTFNNFKLNCHSIYTKHLANIN